MKKQERPESIHHVIGHKVDVGGRGRYLNMYVLDCGVGVKESENEDDSS